MKQNITALVIFVIIITGSLLSLNYTKSICRQINHSQQLCEENIINNNWNAAVEQAKTTKKLWDKYHPRLAILLAHSDLDAINDLIVRVSSLAMLNDKNAFITENKRLTTLVENLSKKDILTFENLF